MNASANQNSTNQNKHYKAFRYRLYPNKEQEVLLEKHFGACRFVYNYFLALRTSLWQEKKEKMSLSQCIKQLPELKKEKPWLKEVNAQSLQQSLIDLEKAFQNFFRGIAKYPNFKKKKGEQSFRVPQYFRIENGRLYIPKFTEGIKVKQHRPLEGKPKHLTIIKTKTGKYFVSVVCEVDTEEIKKRTNENKPENQVIGIDLGLTHFATLSTGEKIDHPRYLRRSEKLLKRYQRQLSRKQKGSKNWHKAVLKVALKHEKIRNQRKDFLHKLSTKLVRENQTICLEDLLVKNMLKNEYLAKSISDSGWSEFVWMLEYKAQWYGRKVIKIPTFYPSSKTCSVCGYVYQDLKLSERHWKCPSCGVYHDRDINAARVILSVGLGRPEFTPVERASVLVEAGSSERGRSR